jgi:DNA-binding response OmpR family regulator
VAGSAGKMLLIVEDERPLSHALDMKLKNQGYTTKVVTNGQDALTELKSTKYDLVLMDLIMPVMDGFGMLKEMKAANISVPVIVLSNLGQDEDRAKTKDLGAIDYFVKSNTPIADIVKRVQSAV